MQILISSNTYLLGADGGLDFGVLRVYDEAKQSLSVKNKGRYEIGFQFAFEPTENCKNPEELFTVIPNKGTLIPSDRPTQVQVMFRSKDEVTIKDEPILKCQVKRLCQCKYSYKLYSHLCCILV